MNGYILNLVTCFDNRGFTKHYNAKVRFLLKLPKESVTFFALTTYFFLFNIQAKGK